MTRIFVALAVALYAAASAASAHAQSGPPSAAPKEFQRLVACRAIADPQQRLSCFDRETAAMSQAVERKDLVMIDRERVRATRRSLFGLSVPSFAGLFGGGGEDEVKQIESTVAGVGQNSDGGWVVSLADGSTWSQTDDRRIAMSPKRGHKAVVRRGVLGSFYMRLDGQPGVKVERVR